MTYCARLGYESSEGKVFTVSEALSGYERMFKDKFGLEVSKIVLGLAAKAYEELERARGISCGHSSYVLCQNT
jgi:hypothetical protein